MAAHQQPPERRVDPDGVARTARQGVGAGRWILGAAAALTGACLVLGLWLTLWTPETPAAEPFNPEPSPLRQTQPPARTPAPAIRRVPVSTRVQAPTPVQERLAREAAEQGVPPEWIAAAVDAGVDVERGGIALFPPPGTDPLKEGLIVPEDFELPAGYVRHYQATDDGTRLPAILMFHPDYTPRDAQGQPLPVPPDRIVPPELAPEGMPLELLEVAPPEEGSAPAPP